MMQQQLLDTARAAAAAGARVLRDMWGGELNVLNKAPFDFVTEADKASENAVLAEITKRHPDHRILAEESAGDHKQEAAGPGVLWVVDPLDGTTNFIHGIPHVAVSVAAMEDGVLQAGVVVDVTRGEEFYGARGMGAFVDGKRLAVSPQQDPARSIFLTGFPFRKKDRLEDYLNMFREVFFMISGIRRAGAAALDLAYVAAGRAEGFWELGLNPWDVAAGALLIEEAGGVLSDFSGGDGYVWSGDVATANPALHPLLREACGRHLA